MRTPAKVLIGLILAAGIFSAGYMANHQSQAVASSDSAAKAISYTCPMHPQYTVDHPGDCPICGMRLEPVGVAGRGASNRAGLDVPAGVSVGSASQQLIGVRTAEARRGASTHVLRVPGRVTVDDQRLFRIVAAVDGWVVDLGENTVGRSVKKNQRLASYYTRDLLSNERLFLLSIPANEALPTQGRDFSQASIRTAGSANPQFPIDALRGLGMSDLQIEEIHRTRSAAPHVDIYSPVSGFVLARNISPQQRFDKGAELYRVADISHVWVMTDIFEKDRAFLQPGGEATIVYQGRRLKARMSDALPQFDAQSRTLKARFELDNPGNLLQPDMFVDVELDVAIPPAITVPADAVFDSGLRKTVYVDRGNGNFEARRVETGWRFGDRVEIVNGLMEGERIVESASFLLDSETRMKAAATGVFEAETDPVCGMEVDRAKAVAAGRKATHGGTDYYFCSDECRRKFEADPSKYAQTPRTPAIQKTADHSHAPTGAAASGRTVAPQGNATDPVCGMEVDPKEATAAGRKSEHAGTTYYFCSDECKKKFDAEPAKYAASGKK